MSDLFETLWCEGCATITAHHVLTDHRFECAPCGVVRTFHASDALYGLPPGLELHTCEECGGVFVADDMHSLGGDRFVEGFAPEAFPPECVRCYVSRERAWSR